jgi:hypothetical protein
MRKRAAQGIAVALDFDNDGTVDALLGYPPLTTAQHRCSNDVDDTSCFGLYAATIDGAQVSFGVRYDQVVAIDANPQPTALEPNFKWTLQQFRAARLLVTPDAPAIVDDELFALGVEPIAVGVAGAPLPSTLHVPAFSSTVADVTSTTGDATTTSSITSTEDVSTTESVSGTLAPISGDVDSATLIFINWLSLIFVIVAIVF